MTATVTGVVARRGAEGMERAEEAGTVSPVFEYDSGAGPQGGAGGGSAGGCGGRPAETSVGSGAGAAGAGEVSALASVSVGVRLVGDGFGLGVEPVIRRGGGGARRSGRGGKELGRDVA